ncbi:Uncharacterised protein [Burkholderia pseudomallei]|nr:Uncharacterised protein [Burkholderia pseudomallei]CAJ3529668.1 Uncharacterised protein [Burkholderia pseudomallei]CAJ7281412.1 Uncharacterised protein [Burkholderia pseudomallei]VBG71826.1 Uncharacterised protein [Burkholderia pseudomallei]VBI52976.1 Uncharacterised protein [Burkholderia pseudomallei]
MRRRRRAGRRFAASALKAVEVAAAVGLVKARPMRADAGSTRAASKPRHPGGAGGAGRRLRVAARCRDRMAIVPSPPARALPRAQSAGGARALRVSIAGRFRHPSFSGKSHADRSAARHAAFAVRHARHAARRGRVGQGSHHRVAAARRRSDRRRPLSERTRPSGRASRARDRHDGPGRVARARRRGASASRRARNRGDRDRRARRDRGGRRLRGDPDRARRSSR